MIHHLTTATIVSTQKVVLTMTENKNLLINIICEDYRLTKIPLTASATNTPCSNH